MKEFLLDHIQGVIYGQAVGDALGLGTEFMSKQQISQNYPDGLSYYDQIIQDAHRKRWAIGDWTDDTDQMLCIFDSLLEKKEIDVINIASHLYQWFARGGIGIGKTVYSVLSSPGFLQNPHSVAKKVWEKSGQFRAPNGAVMRTSILGIWDFQSPECVRNNAEQVCKITHYDPRCISSCIAVCLAISLMLQGASDIQNLIQEVARESIQYDPGIQVFFDIAMKGSLDALNLYEPDKIGYTYKPVGAGFWALQNAGSFEEGILNIINEGGDADANGAVTGALLGAKFGLSNIPNELIDGLVYESELADRIKKLFTILETV